MTNTTSTARKMPVTLREFSQWLDWVAGGKVGTPRTGADAPAGELYIALTQESLAKELIKPLEVDKERALAWLARHAERGVESDPQVTPEYRFTVTRPVRVPAKRKVNADRLKSRYPKLWLQSRDWTPYRSVILPPTLKAPPAPELENALPAPTEELLVGSRTYWPVTWGRAFWTYQDRIEQMKQHKKLVDDAVNTMSRLLTDDAVKAEYQAGWDGHGQLEFEDGVKLQLDRMQFSQERALQVIEVAEAMSLNLEGIIEEVPEHEQTGRRMLVKVTQASNDEQVAKGLGNPFEGD